MDNGFTCLVAPGKFLMLCKPIRGSSAIVGENEFCDKTGDSDPVATTISSRSTSSTHYRHGTMIGYGSAGGQGRCYPFWAQFVNCMKVKTVLLESSVALTRGLCRLKASTARRASKLKRTTWSAFITGKRYIGYPGLLYESLSDECHL